MSPLLLTNNLPDPLVATASWLAPGENTPVSGSPSIASDGAAAVPDAIMPEVKVAVAPLNVVKTPLVKLDVVPVVVVPVNEVKLPVV
jgi:hypothetical protein